MLATDSRHVNSDPLRPFKILHEELWNVSWWLLNTWNCLLNKLYVFEPYNLKDFKTTEVYLSLHHYKGWSSEL